MKKGPILCLCMMVLAIQAFRSESANALSLINTCSASGVDDCYRELTGRLQGRMGEIERRFAERGYDTYDTLEPPLGGWPSIGSSSAPPRQLPGDLGNLWRTYGMCGTALQNIQHMYTQNISDGDKILYFQQQAGYLVEQGYIEDQPSPKGGGTPGAQPDEGEKRQHGGVLGALGRLDEVFKRTPPSPSTEEAPPSEKKKAGEEKEKEKSQAEEEAEKKEGEIANRANCQGAGGVKEAATQTNPQTGQATRTKTCGNGTVVTEVLDEEGEVVQTTIEEFDDVFGHATVTTQGEDGTITRVRTDKDGNVVHEEATTVKRDKDGNVLETKTVSTEHRTGKTVERIDKSDAERTTIETSRDAEGKLVEKKVTTTDPATGAVTHTKQYADGSQRLSTRDQGGVITTEVRRDPKGNVVEFYSKTDAGRLRETTNPETGVTTQEMAYADGSREWGQQGENGESLNRAVQGKDGSLVVYEPGVRDDVFKEAEPVSSSHETSTKVGEREASESRFSQGGEGVSGDSGLLVKAEYRERSGETGSLAGGSSVEERVASRTEIRTLGSTSDYTVTPVGNPVKASGTGTTQEEAINDALGNAAGTVTTRIRGEAVDRQQATGGRGGSTGSETVTSKLDATSTVAFSGYQAHVTRDPDGSYTAAVEATPGLVQRKEADPSR